MVRIAQVEGGAWFKSKCSWSTGRSVVPVHDARLKKAGSTSLFSGLSSPGAASWARSGEIHPRESVGTRSTMNPSSSWFSALRWPTPSNWPRCWDVHRIPALVGKVARTVHDPTDMPFKTSNFLRAMSGPFFHVVAHPVAHVELRPIASGSCNGAQALRAFKFQNIFSSSPAQNTQHRPFHFQGNETSFSMGRLSASGPA